MVELTLTKWNQIKRELIGMHDIMQRPSVNTLLRTR
jgi:hypothetical protein